MKLNNWSCIGAELQGDQIDIEKMTQIYFYRAASGETMDNMLSPNFFNSIYDRIKVNDLILLYHPENKDKRWIKVIKNIGGNVETEEIKGKTVEEAVKWLANRTNIFEIMPLVKYLSTKPFGKQTYIDINIDDFIRIPTKTFGEEAKEIQDIIQDVKEIPHTGAFIVDEQGTYGVVESAIINGNTYESITITTLIPGNTVKKSAKPTIIYGRNAGQEFDYVPTDTFDDSGSSTHLTTTLGLSQSFETPLSTNNKGASITEIKKVDDKIKKVDDKVNEVNKKADIAATSGNLIGSYWFGKTDAGFTPPLPTNIKQNYFDFTTNTPYTANENLDGWTAGEPIENPIVDSKIIITSKLWNIPEQDGQQGGDVYWSHIQNKWISYAPKIISFESPNLTGIPTTPTPPKDGIPEQIANLELVQNYHQAAIEYTDNNIIRERINPAITSSTEANIILDNKIADIYQIDIPDDEMDDAFFIIIRFNDEAILDSNKAFTYELHVKMGATSRVLAWDTETEIKWLLNSETSPSDINCVHIFTFRHSNGNIIANYAGAYAL